MEREADRMEQDSDGVGEHIDETRRDWEAKEQDPSVQGRGRTRGGGRRRGAERRPGRGAARASARDG